MKKENIEKVVDKEKPSLLEKALILLNYLNIIMFLLVLDFSSIE